MKMVSNVRHSAPAWEWESPVRIAGAFRTIILWFFRHFEVLFERAHRPQYAKVSPVQLFIHMPEIKVRPFRREPSFAFWSVFAVISSGVSRPMPSRADAENLSYEDIRRILLSALGRLARQGYAVSPSLGLELIHDFIALELPGLLRRYDARLGGFVGYLYASFLRFARPRIVRLIRWERELQPIDEVVTLIHSQQHPYEPSANQEFSSDHRRIHDALSALPPEQQEALRLRLEGGISEREGAKQLGLSRYAFRQLTAEGLARVAVELDERGSVAAGDWQLARLLWAEGYSLEKAAQFLGWDPQRATASRRRILQTFSTNLTCITD